MLRKYLLTDTLLFVKATQLDKGAIATVTGLVFDVMSGRLMSLGIRKGAQIQRLRKTTGGGILFRVEDHRVVLHRSLGELIEVREEK